MFHRAVQKIKSGLAFWGRAVGGTYIGYLMYADDLVLLSASASDVCEQDMS